jgi:hypothetical protein
MDCISTMKKFRVKKIYYTTTTNNGHFEFQSELIKDIQSKHISIGNKMTIYKNNIQPNNITDNKKNQSKISQSHRNNHR